MNEPETVNTVVRRTTPWSVGRIKDGTLIPVEVAVGPKEAAVVAARKLAEGTPGVAYTIYRPGETFVAKEETKVKIEVS